MEEGQAKDEKSRSLPEGNNKKNQSPQNEWYEEIEEKENHEDTGEYSREERRRLEEEWTRLGVIIADKKIKTRYTMEILENLEEAIEEGLARLRKERSEGQPTDPDEVLDWMKLKEKLKLQTTHVEEWLTLQASKSEYERNIKSKDNKVPKGTITENNLLARTLEAITEIQNNQTKISEGKSQGNPMAEGKERPPPKCYYCHEEGHFKKDCPKRPPIMPGLGQGNNPVRWGHRPIRWGYQPMNVSKFMAPRFAAPPRFRFPIASGNLEQNREENKKVSYNALD